MLRVVSLNHYAEIIGQGVIVIAVPGLNRAANTTARIPASAIAMT